MKVTRHVIEDVLPLYQADECSADTRALVEAFLAQDPELAARVRDADPSLGLKPSSALPPPEPAARVLRRGQTMLRRRMIFLALAVFFSAFPFSFVISSAGAKWVMWREFPAGAATFTAGAVVMWIAYFVVRRRFERSGL